MSSVVRELINAGVIKSIRKQKVESFIPKTEKKEEEKPKTETDPTPTPEPMQVERILPKDETPKEKPGEKLEPRKGEFISVIKGRIKSMIAMLNDLVADIERHVGDETKPEKIEEPKEKPESPEAEAEPKAEEPPAESKQVVQEPKVEEEQEEA